MFRNKADRDRDRDCLRRLEDLVTLCLADGQPHNAEEFPSLIGDAFDDDVAALVMPRNADSASGYEGVANSVRDALKKQGWIEKKKEAGRQCYRVRQVPDHLAEKNARVRAHEAAARDQVLTLLADGKGHERDEVITYVRDRTVTGEDDDVVFACAYRAIAALKREGTIYSRASGEAGTEHEDEQLWLSRPEAGVA